MSVLAARVGCPILTHGRASKTEILEWPNSENKNYARISSRGRLSHIDPWAGFQNRNSGMLKFRNKNSARISSQDRLSHIDPWAGFQNQGSGKMTKFCYKEFVPVLAAGGGCPILTHERASKTEVLE